jgi:hypothetical protein
MDDKETPEIIPDLETQRDAAIPEKPPDGGYGWVVTASVAIVNGHSWGIDAAYSVFLAHFVKEDTFPGTQPLVYAMAGSLGVGVMMLISPFATIMARELGTRPTMLMGAVV